MSKIRIVDAYGEQPERVVEIELSDAERSELGTWTAQKLYDWVRDNVIGKCNSAPSDREHYFCPSLEVGKLTLSLQVGYYLWRKRYEEKGEDADHWQWITAEEFGEVIPDADTSIDVMIVYDGKKLACGQATFVWLAERVAELLAYGETRIYEQL